MIDNPLRLVARLLWLAPALLVFLVVNQTNVALDLRRTWLEGERATAEVVGFENSNRIDVTYGYVNLRVPLGDGRVLEKPKMSLPNTLIHRVEDKRRLDVHVLPGADQEVVIDALMPAHWLIAVAQAGICLLGALIFGGAIYAWNRYLRREGDPAQRALDDEDVHPAQRTVRSHGA
jgi:hypothetical protein